MKVNIAGLKITPDGAKIETSLDEYTYDSDRKNKEKNRQKIRLTRAEREAKSKIGRRERGTSSSESEAETDAVYEWIYGQKQKGEPAQVMSKVDEVQESEAETATQSKSQLSEMDEFVPSLDI